MPDMFEDREKMMRKKLSLAVDAKESKMKSLLKDKNNLSSEEYQKIVDAYFELSPTNALKSLIYINPEWIKNNPYIYNDMLKSLSVKDTAALITTMADKERYKKYTYTLIKYAQSDISALSGETVQFLVDNRPESFKRLLISSAENNPEALFDMLERDALPCLRDRPEVVADFLKKAISTAPRRAYEYIKTIDISKLEHGDALKKAAIINYATSEKEAYSFYENKTVGEFEEFLSVCKFIKFNNVSQAVPDFVPSGVYKKIVESFSHVPEQVVAFIPAERLKENAFLLGKMIEGAPKMSATSIFEALDKRVQSNKKDTAQVGFCLENMLKLHALNRDVYMFRNRLHRLRFSGKRHEKLFMQKHIRESIDRIPACFNLTDVCYLGKVHFMPSLFMSADCKPKDERC